MDIEKFVKERDEALLSLDEKKIKAYMKRYQVRFCPGNETVFWQAFTKRLLELILHQPNKKRSHMIGWLLTDSNRISHDSYPNHSLV